MRFEELLQKEHKKGHESGCVEGENRMQALVLKMMQAGETDKICKLSDKAFLQEMYRKYEI